MWVLLMRMGARLGCHQRVDRSFFIKGYQFPVCARCTGLIIGYMAAIVIYGFIKFRFIIYLALVCPMAIDGITQYIKLRESTQFLRIITGILGGYGLLSMGLEVLRECIK